MHSSASGSIAAALPDRAPSLVTLAPSATARGVALIAHGGRSQSAAPDRNMRTPALRMFPFAGDLARAGRRSGLAVAQLRYRVVGYNDGDPGRDVEWALDELAERFGAPVCLVGHSMGARAALRAAGHESVTAVAGARGLAATRRARRAGGRAHRHAGARHERPGHRPRPLARVRPPRPVDGHPAVRFELARTGHTMLQRLPLWHALTRRFVLGALGIEPMDERLAAAFALPPDGDSGLRVPL